MELPANRSAGNFQPGSYAGDVSLVKLAGERLPAGQPRRCERGRGASACRGIETAQPFIAVLAPDSEAPRPDGGTGWPGLRLAVRPRRERWRAKIVCARRVDRAVFTVLKEHVGRAQATQVTGSEPVRGEGCGLLRYGGGGTRIHLHPTTAGHNTWIGLVTIPIPSGALLPVRVTNLLPSKHRAPPMSPTAIIGCIRSEWNIGEAAGALVAFAHERKLPGPRSREKPGTAWGVSRTGFGAWASRRLGPPGAF